MQRHFNALYIIINTYSWYKQLFILQYFICRELLNKAQQQDCMPDSGNLLFVLSVWYNLILIYLIMKFQICCLICVYVLVLSEGGSGDLSKQKPKMPFPGWNIQGQPGNQVDTKFWDLTVNPVIKINFLSQEDNLCHMNEFLWH